MFQLYANLLSVNARYTWNKIIQEQTKADPYTYLQVWCKPMWGKNS